MIAFPRRWLLVAACALLCACTASAFAPQSSSLCTSSNKLDSVKRARKDGLTTGALLRMEVRGGAMEGKRSIVDRYMAILERRPLYTKMATNYLICFLGDVSCQAMGAGSLRALSRAFDVKRAVLYGSMGALYLAPLAHFWYGALDSAIVKTPAGQVDGAEKPSTATRVTGALKMLFIDQAIASPIVNSGFLFAYAAFTGLAGGSGFGAALHSGSAKVQSALWPTLVASWKIWPAANFLNFMFVPLQLRALFLSVVGVAWNLVLSSIAN